MGHVGTPARLATWSTASSRVPKTWGPFSMAWRTPSRMTQTPRGAKYALVISRYTRALACRLRLRSSSKTLRRAA